MQPGTTLGDLAYSSATANTNTRLGIGSTGNVLTVSGGVPVWSAPAGGGKVLQVVQGERTTGFNTNSLYTYVDTGLEVTITPSSVSSKILIMAYAEIYVTNSSSSTNISAFCNLVRTSTQLQQFMFGVENFASTSSKAFYEVLNFERLDSPATTSATTYKIQANVNVGTTFFMSGSSTNRSSIIAMEIGA